MKTREKLHVRHSQHSLADCPVLHACIINSEMYELPGSLSRSCVLYTMWLGRLVLLCVINLRD